MNKVEIEKEKLMKAYNTADADTKKILEEIYGADVFKADLVRSVKQAKEILGLNPNKQGDASSFEEEFRDSILALYDLMLIIKAQNKVDGFAVDYRPGNKQDKYFPWPDIVADDARPAGFGFSNTLYASVVTVAFVGSRLCVGTGKRANELFDAHQDTYARLFFPPVQK